MNTRKYIHDHSKKQTSNPRQTLTSHNTHINDDHQIIIPPTNKIHSLKVTVSL